ncbi:MAG: nitrous oxide-stimulated promoter family protein [Planctomycetota bacterium]
MILRRRRSRREPARIRREKRTVLVLMRVYCRGVHGRPRGLCASCRELLRYAFARLRRCPYAAEKPTCAHCPIHCYRPEMRERIRAVMRYAGPRALFWRPLLAIAHLLDGRREAPDLRPRRGPGEPAGDRLRQ